MNVFLTAIAGEVLDKFVKITKCDPHKMSVAVIPTAADVYEDKSFAKKDVDKLEELGFKIITINIANKDKKEIQKEIETADIIFVSGGNTFYLLDKVYKSKFNEIINDHLNKGKYYIGSSAGSAILGRSIEHLKTLDEPMEAPLLKEYDGLNIIDKLIIPHFENEKYSEKINKIIEKYKIENILTIKDDEIVSFKQN